MKNNNKCSSCILKNIIERKKHTSTILNKPNVLTIDSLKLNIKNKIIDNKQREEFIEADFYLKKAKQLQKISFTPQAHQCLYDVMFEYKNR